MISDIESKEGINYVFDIDSLSFDVPVCSFSGHRPSKLPFNDENEEAALSLRRDLGISIADAYAAGYKTFISGMALGVDTWAALEVLKLKHFHPEIRLFAAIPYIGQEKGWHSREKSRYFDLLKLCEKVFVICNSPSRQAFVIRDSFMVSHSSKLIAVYDGGNSGGTAITVKMAQKKNIDIDYINPFDYTDGIIKIFSQNLTSENQ